MSIYHFILLFLISYGNLSFSAYEVETKYPQHLISSIPVGTKIGVIGVLPTPYGIFTIIAFVIQQKAYHC